MGLPESGISQGPENSYIPALARQVGGRISFLTSKLTEKSRGLRLVTAGLIIAAGAYTERPTPVQAQPDGRPMVDYLNVFFPQEGDPNYFPTASTNDGDDTAMGDVIKTASLFSNEQADPCTFQLGFELLANGAGRQVVGVCLNNESFNIGNGNAEQTTTNGLLVWRKADNWTAFTNGFRTWVNGPFGVQERLNTERFAFENDPLTADATNKGLAAPEAAVNAVALTEPLAVSSDKPTSIPLASELRAQKRYGYGAKDPEAQARLAQLLKEAGIDQFNIVYDPNLPSESGIYYKSEGGKRDTATFWMSKPLIETKDGKKIVTTRVSVGEHYAKITDPKHKVTLEQEVGTDMFQEAIIVVAYNGDPNAPGARTLKTEFFRNPALLAVLP